MAYVIDPQIIIPSFSEAISQLANITLNQLGVDINSLPFWLAIIALPLAMFETFTKHIATAINVIFHKAHKETVSFLNGLFKAFFTIIFISLVVLYFLQNSQYSSRLPSISQEQLTAILKYIVIVVFIVTVTLLFSSLSYFTGQGNHVTGIGFILGIVSISIEVNQNYGFVGNVVVSIIVLICISLWVYGREYENKIKLIEQRKKESLERKQRIY
ncbi:MAG: hypothetical protein ACI87J_002551 [Colwellia sp.]|jgi:hypothetical protein